MDRLERGLIYTVIVQTAMPIEVIYISMKMAQWSTGGMVRLMPQILLSIVGFILIVIGLVCYLVWVRRRTPRHRLVVWSWIVLEACNVGLVIAMAAQWRNYYPGLLSSLVMVVALVNLGDAMVTTRLRRTVSTP